jgi:hypothetical protein
VATAAAVVTFSCRGVPARQAEANPADRQQAAGEVDELIALADERGAPYWKALGTATRGWLFTETGKASDAIWAITSGITSLRSTGAFLYEPRHLWYLAMAYAELGQPEMLGVALTTR